MKNSCGVRLHNFPRRVADHGVESAPLRREDIGKLQFPMEELQRPCQLLDDTRCLLGRLVKRERRRNVIERFFVGGPEPDGTPLVHCLFQPPQGRAGLHMLPIESLPLVGVGNGQAM